MIVGKFSTAWVTCRVVAKSCLWLCCHRRRSGQVGKGINSRGWQAPPLLLFSDHSFFPSAGGAALVENGDKLQGFSGHIEVDRVGKPAKQSSSDLVLDFRKLEGVFDNPAEDGIELVEEFIT